MKYDATKHEPDTGFTPLPKGRYEVRIAQAQERDNNNRNGRYLWLELEVIGPTHRGRKLWAQMTTEHEASSEAVRIGLGQISAMARSIGRMAWDHEGEIIGLVGECYVGLDRDDPTKNRVNGWVVPTESKGAPTYTRQHQAHGASEHDIHRRGGQLRDALARMPDGRPMPVPRDDDVPF